MLLGSSYHQAPPQVISTQMENPLVAVVSLVKLIDLWSRLIPCSCVWDNVVWLSDPRLHQGLTMMENLPCLVA